MTTALLDLTVDMDAEGFLNDAAAWTPEIAAAIAAAEDIALSDRHWDVINFARAHHASTGEAPTLRTISKQSGVTTKELFQLFPKGPAKKVSRISGLKKPQGCV